MAKEIKSKAKQNVNVLCLLDLRAYDKHRCPQARRLGLMTRAGQKSVRWAYLRHVSSFDKDEERTLCMAS
jgi:hypothetical protein